MGYTKIQTRLPRMGILALVLLAVLTACSSSNNNQPRAQKPQANNPLVEGPVTAGGADDCCVVIIFGVEVDTRLLGYKPGTPFYGRPLLYPEEEVGYRETEYFFSGTATSYIATDELGSDGIWPVAPAEVAEYKSRLVVDRPLNADDFNGTVLVEWFNVTGGLDASPEWNQMHTELTREGYVWVGVSTQFVGIEGGSGLIQLPLKSIDPQRYGSLHHPGDSFSYDIFSQAAQAVRNPMGLDPLEGLQVERMIAVGQSQSASRLTTYYNAIHPTISLFDGFLIHSRGNGSSRLSQEPQVEVRTPSPVFYRSDLPEPVLALQAETDVLNALASRQTDSAIYRLWEVAGSSHTDLYTGAAKGSLDKGNDPMIADVEASSEVVPSLLNCSSPVNDGPGHWVAKAAIASMNRWITTDEMPASAPLLTVSQDDASFELDSLGNVTGGIRTPYVDAPVAILSGFGQENAALCGLYGTTKLFDEAQLFTLYPTKQAYIDAIDKSTDEAVTAGFLLPVDAELIKARARTSSLPAAQPVAVE